MVSYLHVGADSEDVKATRQLRDAAPFDGSKTVPALLSEALRDDVDAQRLGYNTMAAGGGGERSEARRLI